MSIIKIVGAAVGVTLIFIGSRLCNIESRVDDGWQTFVAGVLLLGALFVPRTARRD